MSNDTPIPSDDATESAGDVRSREEIYPRVETLSAPSDWERAVEPPQPCPTCGGIEVWWSVADQPRCVRCSPPHPESRQLLQRARRARAVSDTRPDFAEHRTRPWPEALADWILLLAPDDLPAMPFEIMPGEQVIGRTEFLRRLQADIRQGPRGPRARYGALQRTMEQLKRLLLREPSIADTESCDRK